MVSILDGVRAAQENRIEAALVAQLALREGEFIYSLNRLNVAITRTKCLVFLPRPLLEPSLDVLQNEVAAQGLEFIQALVKRGQAGGQTRVFPLAQPEALTPIMLTAYKMRV